MPRQLHSNATRASSPKPTGAIISATRFRSRSPWVLPTFALHARRTIAQLRTADGYIAGPCKRRV